MIVHESRNAKFRRPFGAVEVCSPLYLSALCFGGGNVMLRLRFHTGELRIIPMVSEGDNRFSLQLTTPAEPCVLWYSFQAGDEQTCEWQITVYRHAAVPDWWKEGVVYQIFPDRFARHSDWQPREPAPRRGTHRFLVNDWYTPAFYPKAENGSVSSWPFWGGTLRGIREKLPYLQSLGITVLYLNPIFEATSNHRYDTADYRHIDPLLGTDEDFAELCRDCRERGMRIVLDGVFNHTGADSIYFDKFGNYGTRGEYRHWFRFGKQYPNGYDSWWNVPDLPNVEESDLTYREFICGEDGVVRHWLRAGASGWRLDVADELPDSFIREIRAAGKAEKPDALLMGEVWEDASCKESYGQLRAYFWGEELDCTMHYPFREILLDFLLGRCDALAACDRLWTLFEHYPRENLYAAMNLLGSHDRERIFTMLGGDRSAWKQAFLLCFALPGVPCVYYGDEAGMTGGKDPWNRDPYPWGREDREFIAYIRGLSEFYHRHPALRSGEYEPVSFGSDVLGCRRWNADEELLVLVNRSRRDVFAEDFGVNVPARGFVRIVK